MLSSALKIVQRRFEEYIKNCTVVHYKLICVLLCNVILMLFIKRKSIYLIFIYFFKTQPSDSWAVSPATLPLSRMC